MFMRPIYLLIAVTFLGSCETNTDTINNAPSPPATTDINNKSSLLRISNYSKGVISYGYASRDGKIVVKPQFYAAEPFVNGIAVVAIQTNANSDSTRYGYLTSSGKYLVKPKYATAYSFSNGRALVSLNLSGDYGYIDKAGSMVLPTIYGDAHHFHEGLAVVQVGEKYGYIDTKGKLVINVTDMRIEGKRIGQLGDFHEGFATFQIGGIYGKMGFINKQGKVVIPPKFSAARSFSQGRALVQVEQNGPSGYIDTTGEFIIKPKYGSLSRSFSEGLACVESDGLFGFVDIKGTMVIPPTFPWGGGHIEGFHEGLCGVSSDGSSWGYIDKSGSYVIQPQYRKAYKFVHGLAEVYSHKSDQKFINIDNETVVPTHQN